jgi:hypothetical protein
MLPANLPVSELLPQPVFTLLAQKHFKHSKNTEMVFHVLRNGFQKGAINPI